jgi:hypothetical protein
LKKEHAAEMATLNEAHSELADMNHNLNNELNTGKDQNERLDQLIPNTSQMSIIWRTTAQRSFQQGPSPRRNGVKRIRYHTQLLGRTHSDPRKSTRRRQSAKKEERANFQFLNEDSSNSDEIITKDVPAKDDEIGRLQIQLNDTSGQLENEHSELETILKNMVEMETSLNREVFHLQNSPEETIKQPYGSTMYSYARRNDHAMLHEEQTNVSRESR